MTTIATFRRERDFDPADYDPAVHVEAAPRGGGWILTLDEDRPFFVEVVKWVVVSPEDRRWDRAMRRCRIRSTEDMCNIAQAFSLMNVRIKSSLLPEPIWADELPPDPTPEQVLRPVCLRTFWFNR